MSRSLWFGSLSILLLASLLFLFVSCFEQPVSPYQPVNTKLYLSVQSSTLQFTIGQYYVDTVGDSINIGVTSNLPQFVDSVTVGIFSDAYLVEQGTILKNINASDKDPTWFKTLLNKDGKKYIIAKAFIQDGYKSFDTIIVNVLPRQSATPPRNKPHITVSGLTTIAAGQLCSLSVSVWDTNPNQAHTFFAKQDTQSQFSVFTPPFKWTPQMGFSGTSTVFFKVADSDSPSYFDTQTVVITVLAVSPTNHAPKWANKTINEVGSPGNAINLTVSKMCTDPDGDALTFSLVTGISPSTGTITTSGDSSIYSFTPGPGDTGMFYPRVIAVDPLGLSDTMTITLKINAVVVKSYSVTYDGNGSTGGSVPSDPSTYTSGSTVTIKTNSGSLVKTGSTFAGWNTAADGTGTAYAAAATFAIGSANITLYAMWIVNTVISAATAGNAQVTLTWAAVTGATSYNIYYTAGTTVDKTGTKVTGATSPAIVAALTNGTQYAFAVSAVNASGESALSSVATATPQVAAAGVPTISSANAGNTQVTVTWAAVTGATSYNIYYATGTTVDKTGTKVTGTTSPNIVAALTNGTQYAFAVSAVNASGESALSTVTTATPQVAAAGVPTISVANAGNAQVTVTWAAVTGATSYNIYYTAGTTVDKTGTKVTGATSPAIVAALTNGTQYAFAVSAVNAGGESVLSAIATATPQVPAPGAPTISSANAGNAQVTVTWAAVTGATSYNIYYTAGTTVDKTGTKVTGSTSPAVVASLTNGTQYAFAVSAVNAGGESALSTVATATPQVPAAGAPTISSANAGNALVTVTWAAVNGATSYNIYYAPGTTVDKTGTKVTGSTSPAVVASLTNGTQYAFAVSAVNAGGESALSAVATATPQVPAAGAPIISSANAGNALVTVTWAAVPGATSYNLYYAKGTTVDKTGTKVSGATSPAVVAALTNGTQYAFAVSAVNAGGESALSTVATATPIVLFVTFNKNDANATGTMANQTIASGSSAALTTNAFAKIGWTFSGWSTTSTGTVAYADGASYTMSTSNVTLYAVWTATTYKLTTIAGTGGTISAPISSPTTVNSGAATTITALPSTGYKFVNWTGPTGATIASTTSASTTVTLNSANATITANFAKITYQLTVSAGTGGTIAAPLNPTSTVNQGDATTITAAPGTGYKFVNWTGQTGVTIASATSASTTVTLTSGDATITANFTLIPPTTPSVSGAPSGMICSGTQVILAATSTNATSFKWYAGGCSGTQINGQTGAQLTVSPTSSTTYAVVAYNGTLSSNCTSVNVGVIQVGTPTLTPAYSTICPGKQNTITVVSSSGLTFNWFKSTCDGITIPGTTNQILIAPTVTTTYYARASNGTCSSNCGSVTVNVRDSLKVSVTRTPGDASICAGSVQISIHANVTGGLQPYHYAMYENGALFEMDDSTFTALPNPYTGGNSTYRVVVTDDDGCVASDSSTVNLIEAGTGGCPIP